MKNLNYYNDIINIFTDASIRKYNTIMYSCAGAILKNKGDFIFSSKLLSNSTNNRGELEGILLGVNLCKDYNIKTNRNNHFNLFSDSLVSIKTLTEWVKRWKYKNGILYGSSGEIKNQDKIFLIMYTILENNLNINLYHQKGHIKNNKASLKKALEVFNRSNNKTINNINFIKEITFFNNRVDNMTRQYLTEDDLLQTSSDDFEKNIFTLDEKNKIIKNYLKLI